MPTIEQYLATATRAARLGLALLIVAGSHVEVLRGRALVTRLAVWAEVEGWMDEWERMSERRLAA